MLFLMPESGYTMTGLLAVDRSDLRFSEIPHSRIFIGSSIVVRAFFPIPLTKKLFLPKSLPRVCITTELSPVFV